MTRPTPLLLFALALFSSCGQPRADGAPLVLAASSLQGALDEEADAWTAAGHARPVLSYGGTPAIARQIEEGAPADLFVSADTAWMDELAVRGLLRPDSRAVLATNTLVVVAAGAGPDRVGGDAVAGLAGDGRVAVADTDSVPAGRYAKAALIRLGAWPAIRPRLVPAENVRAALALVERGAAPLGIVYATDARASAKVRVVGVFPADSHPPIVYPIARIARSASTEAEGFRRFLLSAKGQAVLARHGFGRP